MQLEENTVVTRDGNSGHFNRPTKLFSEHIVLPELLNTAYLPSLDGLRAVSILIVIIGHANLLYKNTIISTLFGTGGLGVNIFFVISGFLITTLLLKEKVKTGTISLKKFYFRRILRILPVAYLYLIVLVILHWFFNFPVSSLAILASLFFVMNIGLFADQGSLFTIHFWSLSVEEQFYIFFPSILKKNFKLYLYFLSTVLLLIVLLGYVDFSRLKGSTATGYFFKVLSLFYEFIVHLDGIIIGSLLSILLFKEMLPLGTLKRYKFLVHFIAVPVIIIFHNHSIPVSPFNSVTCSVLIALVLCTNLTASPDLIYKFLNLGILKKIGVLSYSLYIWQQLFTFRGPALFGEKFGWLNFISNTAILFTIAYLSYEFYEKKFLKLKSRIR